MKAPVLLITFARLDTTLKVIASIRKYKPTKLYISSDYGREGRFLDSHNMYEQQWVTKIREIILQSIDWECEVFTLFSQVNLGCKKAVSSAIDWFFENEDCGIILEDDTVPSQSFFIFCEEMLDKYRNSPEIFMISGWSALDFDQDAKKSLQYDYFFSKYTHIWGWASWRRAWKLYQRDFTNFEREFSLLVFDNNQERKIWYENLKAYHEGKIDTWDYPWTYTIWKHNGLSIYPKNNMIDNIGFNRDDATHTKDESRYQNMKVYDELEFPITHPNQLSRDNQLDAICAKIIYTKEARQFKTIKKIYKKILEKIYLLLFFPLINRRKCIKSGEIAQSDNIFPSQSFHCNGGEENYSFADIFGHYHSFFRPYTTFTQDFIVDVLPNGICFTDKELIFTHKKQALLEYTSFKQHPLTPPIFSYRSILLILSFCKKTLALAIRILKRKKLQANIAVASRFTVEDCYAHTIIDVAINLIQIQSFAKKHDMKIDFYILPTKFPFQKELAQLFGISSEKIISSSFDPQCIQATQLIVPTLSCDYEATECRGFITAHLKSLPYFLIDYYNNISRKNKQKTRKIFLKRPEDSNRYLLNAQEIEEIFVEFGYEIILPDTLTLREKIEIFYQTNVLATVTGSGMANLIFTQNQIQVLEIFPQYFRDSYQVAISVMKKNNYHYMIGETFDISMHPQQEKVYINPKEMVCALQKIEQKL